MRYLSRSTHYSLREYSFFADSLSKSTIGFHHHFQVFLLEMNKPFKEAVNYYARSLSKTETPYY